MLQRLSMLFRPSRAEVARLEALAEKAYAAMSDQSLKSAKQCRDEAQQYLAKALELATHQGMTRTAERLRQRRRQISNTYLHPFS